MPRRSENGYPPVVLRMYRLRRPFLSADLVGQPVSTLASAPLLAAVLLAVGCTSSGQAKGPFKAPVPQHEVDDRSAAIAERNNGKPADDEDPSSRDPSHSDPSRALPERMARAMTAYKMSLRNAAHRDREMEGLIRRYLGLTREVFHHFRASQPGATAGPTSYNPLPAWRFQAQQSFEYRLIAARAAMVRKHLAVLAAEQQLDIDIEPKGVGRAPRIALYSKIMECIQDDAMARADHGRHYIKKNVGPRAKIAPDDRLALYQTDLSMMRRSATCTRLTAMRRPRMIGHR